MINEPVPAIKLQDDFQNFIDEFEVSYRDYNLAEATWIKAEEAMLNKKRKSKLPHPTLPDRTMDGFLVDVKEPKELTQADLQVLTSVLKDIIDTKNYAVSWQKERASKIWDKCDKDNELTQDNFSLLKYKLNDLDTHKKRLKSLVNIQKKLKYLRDN